MTLFSQRVQELRRILKLHANWLLYATVGESALTTEEVAELEAYGKLPMGEALDLVDKSYLLGRMRSTMKSVEYKRASEVVRAVLGEAEDRTLDGVRARTVLRLKRLIDDLMSETALTGGNRDRRRRVWSDAVRTEFQAAKVQGVVQTIANKSDLYANSDGPDSNVSVVPAANCCEDCHHQYLDTDGNPKVFKLSTLLAQGSNADAGVLHNRINGIHANWKTTLPPLHPNCGCTVVYVPPGHGWESGKMSLLNKSLFQEHLAKATAGVRGPGMSATVKPTGAPSVQKEAGHPSVPGAAAPGNVAGPGRPPGGLPKPGSGTPGGAGGGRKLMACPLADCPDGGMHEPDSKTMIEHTALAQKTGRMTKQAEEAHHKQSEAASKEFNGRSHKQQIIHDHLSSGEIGSMRKLAGDDAGQNASYKVSILGNGSGLMKPHISVDSYLSSVYKPEKLANKSPNELKAMADELTCPGAGTMPEGMNPRAEAGMSGLANGLGLGSLFPVTVLRAHDGSQAGPKGLTSVQHWKDNAVSTTKYAGGETGYKAVMKAVPKEHQDKVHEQFSTIAVMDMISNNGDRHFGNIMVDQSSHDLVPIDHGTAFGNGMYGSRNGVAQDLHDEGIALTIPPQLHERLKNTSLDATMRSLDESGLPEWSKAQTFLRTKYALHLQEKFDHIPFDRVRTTVTSRSGSVNPYWNMKTGDCPGWNDKGGLSGFFKAQEEGSLPHEQFDGFAKAWMEERVNDPSHPEHNDAKRLFAMQPIRSSAHVTGREEATAESLAAHYKSIRSYDLSEPNAASVKRDMPRSKKFGDSAAVRTAPELPKTGAQRPSRMEEKTGAQRPSKMEQKTGAQRPSKKTPTTTMELAENDLEAVDPKKNYSPAAFERTNLQLDLDEFKEDPDADIDAAFDKIRAKSKVSKGLYLNLDRLSRK